MKRIIKKRTLNEYILFMCRKGFFNFLSDKQYLKLLFRLKTGYKLSLNEHVTFNEKLQWLKLNDRNPLYTALVDKYAVRQYISDTIGNGYLIPLVGGPWKSFDEIDFTTLPDQFVLKCTHDSGGVIICRDKNKLNKEEARLKITRSIKQNYYLKGREWPYKDVTRKIIAEKYMEDETHNELRDYKFFCFNGEPKIMFVGTERQAKDEEVKFDFFDMDYNYLRIKNGHPNAKVIPKKPINFDKMEELAGILSKGIPHVRIDFYEVNGKVYFGEYTFYHFSGMVPFAPEEWDYKLGEWIKLPNKY